MPLPAPGRRTPVIGHDDDVLQHHVVVEIAGGEALRPEQQHRPPDPLGSDIDAPLLVFEGAGAGEERSRLIPQPLVEIVAERGGEVLDVGLVLEPFDAFAVGSEPCLRRLRDGGSPRGEGTEAEGGGAQEVQHGLAGSHQRVPFTDRPVTGLGAWKGGFCTSGKGLY